MMETPEMITLEAYRNSIREYNKLKDKAEEFASRISTILYDVMFSIQGIELVDDDHINIFGHVFWGGYSEQYVQYTTPLEWFILSEEELVPAIDRWIHEYREAKKQKEEEEHKKKEEAWRKQELAELARLQEKYGKEAQ